MDQPTNPEECTFINLTDNPSQGRESRRKHVRRTVMRDYHQRRKRRKNPSPDEVALIPPRTSVSRVFPTLPVPMPSLARLEPQSTTLLRPKTWTSPQQAQISRLIIQYLGGLTQKAGQDMSCVAFVHRGFKDMVRVHGHSKTPLEICGEVLHSFENDTYASAADRYFALWTRVHRHQEEIYLQCESLSQWDLLSACQAVALYLLLWMRKRDHCSQFPCGNIALLFTLGRITKLLQSRYLHLSPSTNVLRPVNDWAAWIFCESCIRLASLYFVMNIVVSMDIGFSCDGPTDWRLQALPLPASKVVWDADTEAAWLSAIGGHANLNRRTLFGDLFDKKRVADHRAGVWEDSVDELGLIVGMAGSLFTTMS